MLFTGRRRMRLLVGVGLACLTACLTVACEALPGDQGGGAWSAFSWDLSEPPTREDVGMEDEASTVRHESDDPVTATFELPRDTSLELPVVRVVFDNLGAVPARGSDPTGFEARTDQLTLATLVQEYRSTLEQLGVPTGRVRKFEYRAGSAEGGVVHSRTSRRRYGYLKITVAAHFAAGRQRGYLRVTGAWGRS